MSASRLPRRRRCLALSRLFLSPGLLVSPPFEACGADHGRPNGLAYLPELGVYPHDIHSGLDRRADRSRRAELLSGTIAP